MARKGFTSLASMAAKAWIHFKADCFNSEARSEGWSRKIPDVGVQDSSSMALNNGESNMYVLSAMLWVTLEAWAGSLLYRKKVEPNGGGIGGAKVFGFSQHLQMYIILICLRL